MSVNIEVYIALLLSIACLSYIAARYCMALLATLQAIERHLETIEGQLKTVNYWSHEEAVRRSQQ